MKGHLRIRKIFLRSLKTEICLTSASVQCKEKSMMLSVCVMAYKSDTRLLKQYQDTHSVLHNSDIPENFSICFMETCDRLRISCTR